MGFFFFFFCEVCTHGEVNHYVGGERMWLLLLLCCLSLLRNVPNFFFCTLVCWQTLTFYELDLGLNHVVRKYTEPLEEHANMLIAGEYNISSNIKSLVKNHSFLNDRAKATLAFADQCY